MIRIAIAAALTAALAGPAGAIVGGARDAEADLGRSVVTIVGSRGNFCSGAAIAPAVVLTAAHCVAARADYKVVVYDAQRRPELRDVAEVVLHPQFSAAHLQAHRATADVAVLRLARPLPEKTAAPLGTPRPPLSAGRALVIAGIGVTQRGDGRSGGIARSATLVATGRPGSLQIRLVDPVTDNKREGLGACTGDSGGPVFEDQNGRAVIVGVVSWSTAANNAAGCGGLTGTTPLTLYRDWIETALRAFLAH